MLAVDSLSDLRALCSVVVEAAFRYSQQSQSAAVLLDSVEQAIKSTEILADEDIVEDDEFAPKKLGVLANVPRVLSLALWRCGTFSHHHSIADRAFHQMLCVASHAIKTVESELAQAAWSVCVIPFVFCFKSSLHLQGVHP